MAKKVSKKRLLAVSDKYPPNGFIKWVYRNYSTNLKKKPAPIGSFIAIIGFSIATIGMIVFDQLDMKPIANTFASLYSLFFAWIISLPAYIMNKIRVKKIVKELGITPEAYNKALDYYDLND